MTSQDQNVSGGGTAYQGGRDVVVNQGLTPTQMKEILNAVAALFPSHIAVAKEIVNDRIQEFEKRFLDTFTSGKAKSEAFRDPDFVYVVKEAQHAYLRCGDDGVRDTLVDLIARRSVEQTRSRLSLTLNEAVQKSALLTKNEFAELSLVYLVRSVVHTGLKSMEDLARFFRQTITPLLPDISREAASYQYLAAHSCAAISSLGSSDTVGIFRAAYAGLFSRGFSKEDLENRFAEDRKHLAAKLLMPCMQDPAKFQVNVLNRQVLDQAAKDLGLTKQEVDAVWGQIESTTLNGEDWTKLMEKHIPEIRELNDLWSNSLLNRVTLTTVGIAIGHANLVRLCNLEADLRIWIK